MSDLYSPASPSPPLSNGVIATELMSLAQLLAAHGENPFKVKAYRRAARTLRTLSESIEEIVKGGGDLTVYPGIGKAISGVIEEIVCRSDGVAMDFKKRTVPLI